MVDYRHSDALLAHVVLDDLLVSERVQFFSGCGEKDLERSASRCWCMAIAAR